MIGIPLSPDKNSFLLRELFLYEGESREGEEQRGEGSLSELTTAN